MMSIILTTAIALFMVLVCMKAMKDESGFSFILTGLAALILGVQAAHGFWAIEDVHFRADDWQLNWFSVGAGAWVLIWGFWVEQWLKMD